MRPAFSHFITTLKTMHLLNPCTCLTLAYAHTTLRHEAATAAGSIIESGMSSSNIESEPSPPSPSMSDSPSSSSSNFALSSPFPATRAFNFSRNVAILIWKCRSRAAWLGVSAFPSSQSCKY